MKLLQIIAKEPTVFLLRKVWQYAGDKRKQIIPFCLMLILGHAILLISPLLFGKVISEIQHHGVNHENFSFLIFLLSLIIAKDLAFWALHGPARVIERMVAFTAELNFRKYLLKGVIDLGLTWHGDHDSGDTIDKVNKAGTALSDFGQNIFQILQVAVKLLGTCAVLVWFSPIIGWSVLVFVLLSFFFIFQFDQKLLPLYRRINDFSNKASAGVFDSLSNITSVKILHIEQPILRGVMARYSAARSTFRSIVILNELKWFSSSMMYQIVCITPVGLYIYYNLSSNTPVDAGQISTLYLYLSDLIFVHYSFGSFYEQFVLHKNRVLNAEPIEKAFESAQLVRKTPIQDWQELNISNLSFSYDGKNSLKDIATIIKRGERIALIGESGSGKTTFLKVLHGLYAHAQGAIAFDNSEKINTNFADLDLKTMLVPQEPEIFSSTIRENITLGLDKDERQIMHVCRIAAFDDVVSKLPKGLDSIINEKGVNMSGGQKQRLALARALLFSHEKDLLLLDESTSSVDPENEIEIYQNIWQEFRAKTIIASVHKMNLLKLFDRILIFEAGHIAAHGTFDELIKNNSSFKHAWKEFVTTSR